MYGEGPELIRDFPSLSHGDDAFPEEFSSCGKLLWGEFRGEEPRDLDAYVFEPCVKCYLGQHEVDGDDRTPVGDVAGYKKGRAAGSKLRVREPDCRIHVSEVSVEHDWNFRVPQVRRRNTPEEPVQGFSEPLVPSLPALRKLHMHVGAYRAVVDCL